MKPHFWTMTDSLRWGALGALTLAIFVAVLQMASDETGLPYRYWGRYTGVLDRKLRSMFIFNVTGRLIAFGQLAVIFLLLAAGLTIDDIPYGADRILILVALFAPYAWIEKMRRERVLRIDDQLDNFILALANALKTTPSIGAAFNSVVIVIEDPIKKEVDLAIKEMKVGSTLDQALLHMAARVGSRSLDSALSAILIGRQVGGNLPKVLETTAHTLREMKRLEGVIRTKTADGRMQMWVIALMPVVFIVILSQMFTGYFNPLTQSVTGYIIIIIIGGCWVGSLLLARKVLQVDF